MPDPGQDVSFSGMPQEPPLPSPRVAFVPDLRIRLLYLDHVTIGRDWAWTDVCSGFWRAYVNNRSGASIEWSGGVHPLAPGRVHLVPAWVRFRCAARRPVSHLFLHFDVTGLPSGVVRGAFDRPFSLPAPAVVRDLGPSLLKARQADRPPDLVTLARAKSLLYLCLAAAWDALPPAERTRGERWLHQPPVLRPALELMEQQPGAARSLAELARLCHVGPDHFARLFRRHLGVSPARHLRERRIARAAERLAFSRDSIDTISDALGFPNRFHFTRVFRQLMGVPPGAYRKHGRI